MADRKRFRPGRLLVVVILALLIAFLLELNRFLPGVWPGGGGDRGSRPVASGTTPAPDRVVPGGPIAPPKPAGRRVAVVVAPPAGSAPADASVRLGGAVASRAAGTDATTPLEVSAGPADDELAVRLGAAEVRHGVPRVAPPSLRVAFPAAAVGPRPPPGDGRTVVVKDERGPIAGAQVRWESAGHESVGQADADGRLRVPRGASPLVKVCASSADHVDACLYAHLDAPGPLEVVLVRRVPVATSFVAPGGAGLRPSTLRIRPLGGPPRALARDEGFDALNTALPTDLVATGRLEIEAPGRPPVSVPLASLGERTVLPPGRPLAVRVRDPRGAPAAGARVEARWNAEPGAEPADAARLSTTGTTDANGDVVLPVPTDREVTVVAEGDGTAPATGRLAPGDGAARTELALAPAGRVAVRVRDADGHPAAAARVVALVRVGDTQVRRQAATDADGVARLEGLPVGRVDVHAHTTGHAWSAVDATTRADEETSVEVRLARGARLHLVVEDPDGVPLPGVAVRSVERPDAAGSPPPPADPDRGPWVTDANGSLVVDDLPPRALDLFLHLEGYVDEAVADVLPGPTLHFSTLVPAAR
ncbi:MAG: carboxypeptidase regulatory-like domain-containing protein [Planctomycetota bacterium]